MRISFHRLAACAITFALGVGSDRAIRLPSNVNRDSQTEIASSPMLDRSRLLSEPQELSRQSDNGTEKVSQTENVRLLGIGIVRISAHEDFGQTVCCCSKICFGIN